MPRYCSNCCIAGHNKNNKKCIININTSRVNEVLEQVEFSHGLSEKLRILRVAIENMRTMFSDARGEVFVNRNTSQYYNSLYLEARMKHFAEQRNGNWESCIATYNEMQCAQASFKIMEQNYISSCKILNNIYDLLNKLILQETLLLRVTQKRTSEYFKSVSLILDLTEGASQECPLCYDQIEAECVLKTNCKHAYCAGCIKNMATSIKDKTVKPSCPLCREIITEINFGDHRILEDCRAHLVSL